MPMEIRDIISPSGAGCLSFDNRKYGIPKEKTKPEFIQGLRRS
jgi:hypothetical protein